MTLLTNRTFRAALTRDHASADDTLPVIPKGTVVPAYGLPGQKCLVWYDGRCYRVPLSRIDLVTVPVVEAA